MLLCGKLASGSPESLQHFSSSPLLKFMLGHLSRGKNTSLSPEVDDMYCQLLSMMGILLEDSVNKEIALVFNIFERLNDIVSNSSPSGALRRMILKVCLAICDNIEDTTTLHNTPLRGKIKDFIKPVCKDVELVKSFVDFC